MNVARDVTNRSSPEEKIALFRSYFRGREDVYPRRFESRRTGKSGYQPACANEWVRGLCDKRAVKCALCPNRRFLAVTDETVRLHLSGDDRAGREFVMGIYPMLLDETCFFLAMDFDKATWREDVLAVLETCRGKGFAAGIECSRSGNGAHLWMFFEEAVPAAAARKLGASLLTETMERRPDIGLDSYDRFFPNQDTLPSGGFGNLIALPLQRSPRTHGNTVFLDAALVPHSDQWKFLSSLMKISRAEVDVCVRVAEARGRIIDVRLPALDEDTATPWTAPPSRLKRELDLSGPLPRKIDLVLGNEFYIEKKEMTPGLRNRLLRVAAFQNPEFYKSQAMRLPVYDKPRIICCAEDHPLHLALPRGCLEEVRDLLSRFGIESTVRDERNHGQPLDASFRGVLRADQRAAASALVAHDFGVLSATTAFGKTVVAAWLIAERAVNTLVLVHRTQLLEQWVERLSSFLGISVKAIGRIGGGRTRVTGSLDVALIQSLVRKGVVKDLVGEYGHIVVDECHHLPAHSFEQAIRRAKPRYVTGLSATVTRKDGHHPIILMQCGPIRFRSGAKQQAAARPFRHVVLVRPTSFRHHEPEEPDARMQFHVLYQALIADTKRTRTICDDVVMAAQEGRSPLVLTERTCHLAALEQQLTPRIRHVVVLQGGMGKKKLKAALARLEEIPAEEERVILATGRFIGEGFDDARLDTLFLTLPVSWRGTIAQYVGRLHRLREGKREVRVYDYADLEVPALARMFDRRCRGYEAVGYSIQLPAGALPGWPLEVPLPVDPEWKRNYSASVSRLARDSVDEPLANLFVHAARSIPSGARGAERARSASEAFLYRRLETLRVTAGRFRVNEEIPIAFDQRGHMEVDLLCRTARVAVEIDGPQHLSNPEAYRRDRRKDALLQEHGYFVLRFLAEDVGKHLDEVLDRILRTLAHRDREGPYGNTGPG